MPDEADCDCWPVHITFYNRSAINKLTNGGSTVNLCAIDLSKAFDKTNHHALLMKLMKRHIPVDLLDILEFWLGNSWSCIKWLGVFSAPFKIGFGVRQGSVLSPFLFAVYLNDLALPQRNGLNNCIILYADDILLFSPSLCRLQLLLAECERELTDLDMSINVRKSCCLRIGPRFDAQCANIVTLTGHVLPWVDNMRYLGIYILSSRTFSCSLDQAKRAYFRSLNAIFGKVGRIASEEVVLQLVASKCLPILLYGTEACGLRKSEIRSLDFLVTRFLMRLFQTNNMNIIKDCITFFDFKLPSSLLVTRASKFIANYNASENLLCRMARDPAS